MVPVYDGNYLVDALFEVGPSATAGMGSEIPVSWVEIWAYAQSTQNISEPWEFRAIMQMSKAFVRARREGESVFAIPPMEQVEND